MTTEPKDTDRIKATACAAVRPGYCVFLKDDAYLGYAHLGEKTPLLDGRFNRVLMNRQDVLRFQKFVAAKGEKVEGFT